MSHEIRTPMNAILGYTQLLLRDPSLNSVQQKNLGIINKSGDHLLTIINDILEISKIEAGQMEFEIIDFDLRIAIEELIDIFTPSAYKKNLEFEIEKRTVELVNRNDELKIEVLEREKKEFRNLVQTIYLQLQKLLKE